MGSATGGIRGFFSGAIGGAISGFLGLLGFPLLSGAAGAFVSSLLNGDSLLQIFSITLLGIGLGLIGKYCILYDVDELMQLDLAVFSVDVQLWATFFVDLFG